MQTRFENDNGKIIICLWNGLRLKWYEQTELIIKLPCYSKGIIIYFYDNF